FGTNGAAAAPFNLGRTTTHEIGHWLNLRHIWGDDENEANTCSGSDLVDDTPNQAIMNFGKPKFPHISCKNGPNWDMFMNYMDYTDDDSMFMFTLGQSVRMDGTLFDTRKSLLTSNGLQPPGGYQDLWAKDTYFDVGDQPNKTTTVFWESPDIWVR